MQTQKIIEALGYTPNEAKVYLAALQMGECHVSDLAGKLKMPRSSVQMIVEHLGRSGLMSAYVKNRYTYWVAEKPERLLEQLHAREDMVKEAIPQLSRLQKSSREGIVPMVRVFAGRHEVENIFEDILQTKQHVLAIIPEDSFVKFFEGTSTLDDFAAARARNFLRIRMLVPNTPSGRALAQGATKLLREVRFLPDRIQIKTASFIYGDKVAFIMFNERQPTAVLIEDAAIRDTKGIFFEELWSASTPAR